MLVDQVEGSSQKSGFNPTVAGTQTVHAATSHLVGILSPRSTVRRGRSSELGRNFDHMVGRCPRVLKRYFHFPRVIWWDPFRGDWGGEQ